MLKIIQVLGKASAKAYSLQASPAHADMSLLDFLRSHGLPIASSCSGKGKCRKCVFNTDKLSCEIKVKDFIKGVTEGVTEDVIEIDYL